MRANLPPVVVILALVAASFSISQAEEPEADGAPAADLDEGSAAPASGEPAAVEQDQEETPSAGEDGSSSGEAWRRNWFEVRVLVDPVGYDSNPQLSDSAEEGDGFWGWGGDLEYSHSWFRSADPGDHLWDRRLLAGAALEGEATRYWDNAASNRQSISGRAYAEWAPFRVTNLNPDGEGRKAFRLKPVQGLSFGALYRFSSIRAGSAPFLESYRTIGALAYSLSRNRECDLTKVILFGSSDRIDDRTDPSDPALDRDGLFKAFGVRFTWVVRTPAKSDVCVGGGIFRDPLFYDHATFRVEGQWGSQETDGTKFDRDVDAYFAGGSVPLWRKEDLARLLFEGELEYDTTDHSSVSVVAPLIREDRLWRVDVGLVYLLMRQSNPNAMPPPRYTDVRIRLGTARSGRSSNLPGLDFDRWAVTLTFDILHGRRTAIPTAVSAITPSPGSNIDPIGGPELPEVVTEP